MRGSAAAALAIMTVAVPAATGAAVPGKAYIPPLVAMRDMTPAEESANRIWNLRAALNVAALQCQFSPFLRTVGLYNNIIKHHSIELDKARAMMAGHFRRYDGVKGSQGSFDQYTTRTYSSYSTLDAQLAFCDTAAMIGRQVLATPAKGLAAAAERYLPEIRASLSPQDDPMTRVELFWVAVPQIDNPCLDRRGRPIKRCP